MGKSFTLNIKHQRTHFAWQSICVNSHQWIFCRFVKQKTSTHVQSRDCKIFRSRSCMFCESMTQVPGTTASTFGPSSLVGVSQAAWFFKAKNLNSAWVLSWLERTFSRRKSNQSAATSYRTSCPRFFSQCLRRAATTRSMSGASSMGNCSLMSWALACRIPTSAWNITTKVNAIYSWNPKKTTRVQAIASRIQCVDWWAVETSLSFESKIDQKKRMRKRMAQ